MIAKLIAKTNRTNASLVVLMLTGMFFLLFTQHAYAEQLAEQEVDWFYLTMALFGGLAMFLYGMEQMSDGLQSAAGDRLKDVLAGLTKNRFLGAITGVA